MNGTFGVSFGYHQAEAGGICWHVRGFQSCAPRQGPVVQLKRPAAQDAAIGKDSGEIFSEQQPVSRPKTERNSVQTAMR